MKGTTRATVGILAFAIVQPVFAHPGAHHAVASLPTGLMHPLFGWDHLLALLAIGLWSAQQRKPMMWALPLVFLSVMALAAMAGVYGIDVPFAESGIAASVAILGLLIAFAVRMPAAASVALVSLFAMVHGYAHGIEMPEQGSGLAYGAGFIFATAMLHGAGVAIALLARANIVSGLVRSIGAAIAMGGVVFLAAAT